MPDIEPKGDFTQSFDARDWAAAFVKIAREKGPEFALDESNMLGWFANALMRGHDEHARRFAENPFADSPEKVPQIGHDVITVRERKFEFLLNNLDTILMYCGVIRDERSRIHKLIGLLLDMPPDAAKPAAWRPDAPAVE